MVGSLITVLVNILYLIDLVAMRYAKIEKGMPLAKAFSRELYDTHDAGSPASGDHELDVERDLAKFARYCRTGESSSGSISLY